MMCMLATGVSFHPCSNFRLKKAYCSIPHAFMCFQLKLFEYQLRYSIYQVVKALVTLIN
jgi:hypothetical protein